MEWVSEKVAEECQHGSWTRKRIPEDYLENEVDRVKALIGRVIY